jgi:hypothetical protein
VDQSEPSNKGSSGARTFGDPQGRAVIRRPAQCQITTPWTQYKYLPPPTSFFPSPSTVANNLHHQTFFSIKYSPDSIESHLDKMARTKQTARESFSTSLSLSLPLKGVVLPDRVHLHFEGSK